MKIQVRYRESKKAEEKTVVVELALLPTVGSQIAIEGKPHVVESVVLLPQEKKDSPAALVVARLVKKNPILLTFTDPL
jgi:hypothetical protein